MSNDQSFKNRKPAMGKAEPGTIKRIFSYIFQYKWRVIAIVVCILVGAAAQAGSALFLQSLIDTYILPMVGESNSDWVPLLRAISLMAGLYVAGIVASWLWQWLIVTVEQGTLKKIRDDMFAHQQKLPIRYFDSHEHGDIMSHYTNDTDTLRQAISQSFPQMFSSIISAVAALLSMLWLSIPFTAFVIVFTVLLYFIVRKIVSRSGRYFVKQQQWIGDVNAFVEESVNGQKVNIPSYLVRVGDVIEVKEGSRSAACFKRLTAEDAPMVNVPQWLQRDKNALKGTVLQMPAREDIDMPIEEHLIVELYSK